MELGNDVKNHNSEKEEYHILEELRQMHFQVTKNKTKEN